jgi:hypothetical protein
MQDKANPHFEISGVGQFLKITALPFLDRCAHYGGRLRDTVPIRKGPNESGRVEQLRARFNRADRFDGERIAVSIVDTGAPRQADLGHGIENVNCALECTREQEVVCIQQQHVLALSPLNTFVVNFNMTAIHGVAPKRDARIKFGQSSGNCGCLVGRRVIYD